MDVRIAPVRPEQLTDISEALARWQREPTMHVCYLGTEAEPIAADLEALEPAGLDAAVAAWRDRSVVGFLAAEWDEDPPRVWWHGPFVDPTASEADELADVMYQRLRLSLPRTVDQEELAADDRHATVEAFARRHGFERGDDASALFILEPGTDAEPPGSHHQISPLDVSDHRPVARLHDELFPGTHSTGERLTSGEHHEVLLVARDHGVPVGYIACEHQSDGTGYIDYVGVDPGYEGRGIGQALLWAGVEALRDRGCGRIALTVRESNTVARRLYRRLGFTEERLLRRWRKGC